MRIPRTSHKFLHSSPAVLSMLGLSSSLDQMELLNHFLNLKPCKCLQKKFDIKLFALDSNT